MNKEAGVLELVMDRLRQYGPQAALIGAGLAGLSHAAYSSDEEKKKEKKEEDNSVYVTIPEKTAADTSQYLLDAGISGGAILGAGTAGYLVLDKVLQKMRKKDVDKDLERAKSEYARLLSQRISEEDEENKMASGDELSYPNIEALCYAVAIAEAKEAIGDKTAEVEDPSYLTLATSMPSLAALVGGVLAHNYWYDRQKNIEAGMKKRESEEMKKAPVKIKLKSEKKKEEKEEEKMGESALTEEEANVLNAVNGNFFFNHKGDGEENDKDKNEVDMTMRNGIVEPIDHNTTVVHTEKGDTVVEAQDAVAAKVMEKAQKIIAKNLAMAENLD